MSGLGTTATLAVLGLYGALHLVSRTWKPTLDRDEVPTFLALALVWGIPVFVGNYLLYLAGVMSFLPWANNFLHAVVWIGGCLSFMYLGLRETQPLWLQMVVFATFSLIVKYFEQWLLGTWEHSHFFWVFRGNFAYVLGWSLLDGLYPPLSRFALRAMGRVLPGLQTL